uniref:Hexosyltransferase n=1 Tax=Plectus sambesii TaxID=2011161 RepID=A0A914WP57_9BILA
MLPALLFNALLNVKWQSKCRSKLPIQVAAKWSQDHPTPSDRRRHRFPLDDDRNPDGSMRRACLLRLTFVGYASLLVVLLLHHYLLLDLSGAVVAELVNRTEARLNDALQLSGGVIWARQQFVQSATFGTESRFLLTPTMGSTNCSRLLTVYILKSRPDEFFQRAAIRDTWGKTLKGRLVFVVGQATTSAKYQVETALKLEADRNKDLLFVDFADTYKNLSLKSVAILRWADRFCQQASFFFQGDTDAVVFPEVVENFATKHIANQSRIYGSCWKLGRVVRVGKWQMDQKLYVPTHYPTYCSGAAYLMTRDIPGRLLGVLQPSRPYFPIDDAFFTGVLAEAAGVQRISIDGIHWRDSLESTMLTCKCPRVLAVIEFKSSQQLRNAWHDLSAKLRVCSFDYD